MSALGGALIGDGPQSLILTRHDIAGLMDRAAWLDAAELAFRALGEGRAQAPAPMAIEADGGAFHAKGASLRLDRLYVAMKLNGNFPGNAERHGLPTIQGAILLCDGADGRLLAVLDSIEVTLRRTAAATALAAQLLARPESRTLLVCGCGKQGVAQLEALADVLPIGRCLLWDSDVGRAHRLASLIEDQGALNAEIVEDVGIAARKCDVIATCTTATTPFLEAGMIRPGTFIAAVGADSHPKSEIAPELMGEARVVTDLTAQASVMGDLHHALVAGTMSREDVHAELHEVLLGTKAGRSADDEVVLFDSTGTAVQDAAACVWIHERAGRGSGRLALALGAA